MPYGLQVFDASGNKTFDSRESVGGVPAAVYSRLGGSGSLVATFPDFPGRTAAVIQGGSGWEAATVDYALGYPRVTMPASGAYRLYMVFIR